MSSFSSVSPTNVRKGSNVSEDFVPNRDLNTSVVSSVESLKEVPRLA